MKKILATILAMVATSATLPAWGAAATYEVGAGKTYSTLTDAIAAAVAGGASEVVYEIYDAQTVNWTGKTAVAPSAAAKVSFVGMSETAGIHLQTASSDDSDCYGGIESTSGADFLVQSLTITHTKRASNYTDDWARRVGYWYVLTSGTVTYKDCSFTQGGILVTSTKAVFDGCTFDNQISGCYALWTSHYTPESETEIVGCTFTGTRAVKVYAEGDARITSVEISGSKFNGISEKGAVDIGVAKTVTIEGNKFIACEKGIVSGDGAATVGLSTEEQLAALAAANVVSDTDEASVVTNSVRAVNSFGAIKIENNVASNMFVAVPFEGFDGAARKAQDAVHAAGLADGTKMYVYDPAADKYDVFEASSGAWTKASKVTVGADGTVSVDDPNLERPLAAGSGVIVDRKSLDAPVYVYGQVPSSSSVTLAEGASLVCAPSTNALEAVDLNALTWTGVTSSGCNAAGTRLKSGNIQDVIRFRGADNKMVNYYYFNGKWGAEYRPSGWDGKATVPAGTAFWYTAKSAGVTMGW